MYKNKSKWPVTRCSNSVIEECKLKCQRNIQGNVTISNCLLQPLPFMKIKTKGEKKKKTEKEKRTNNNLLLAGT